jgi:hypothetical protein
MGKASSILATAPKNFPKKIEKTLDKQTKVWYNKYRKRKER